MPAPSGRNKAGKGSSGASLSANGAALTGKDRRKTLAYDGNLLGTDSESGSGSDAGEPAQTAVAVPRKKGGSKATAAASTSKVSSKASKAPASVGEVQRSSPGSRRSTRLSGEGVQSGGSDNEGGSSRAASGKVPSKSAKVVPSKRKQPESGSGSSKTQNKTSGTTQPTPPLTDPEETEEQTETSRQSQSSNRSGKAASGSSSQAKKAKADSGQRTSPLRKTTKTAPAPRVSEVADDSFAWVQVDGDAPALASNVASTSTSAHPVVTSPNRRKTKNSPQRTQASGSKSSTNLASSLEAVASRQVPAAARQASASDAKGKRRADAMDESVQAEESSQTSTIGQKSKSQADKPRKKKKDQSQALAADRGEAEQGTPRKQTTVPTNTQETPAIRRNQAMRAGLGPPGTPGSIVRRSSSERGRRGSSIGNGFEALPHPSLPTNTLYRHIKADDPPAIRFRTLVTWSVHRLKEDLEAKAKEEPRSADRKAAVAIAEALIKDLAEKRIDLSWQSEEAAAQDDAFRNLPPNPINVENAEKLVACEAWTARLKKEDEIRNARINQYKVMTESITALINTLPPAPPALPDGTVPPLPDVVTPNFSQPLARLKTREDMLAYGRILCQPKAAPSRRKSVAPPPSSLDGDGDPDVVNADTETTFSAALGELRHHAASLQQSSYRLDQFLKVSNTFIDLQLEETQRRLRDLTLPSGMGGDRAVSAAREGSGLHIAAVAGAGGSSSERGPGLGLTELLRQISRVSVASKHSAGRR